MGPSGEEANDEEEEEEEEEKVARVYAASRWLFFSEIEFRLFSSVFCLARKKKKERKRARKKLKKKLIINGGKSRATTRVDSSKPSDIVDDSDS